MPALNRTSRGVCCLCGTSGSKRAIARHLVGCSPTHDQAGSPLGPVFHLQVVGAGTPFYWIDLEAKASAKLAELDKFLRKIWLECCGHLSAFRIGSTVYTIPMDDPFGAQNERSLNVRLAEAFEFAPRWFFYEYDFGSTTHLRLRIMGRRSGVIGRRLIRLLARNEPPVWLCHICHEPASLVCPYCLYEIEAFYCEKHSRAHRCENSEDTFLPVVNSPRMGVCGYPGEPPW